MHIRNTHVPYIYINILGECSALWGKRESYMVQPMHYLSHLYTSHVAIVSFPSLPHLQCSTCKTPGGECLGKRLYGISNVCHWNEATATGNKVSKHLEAAWRVVRLLKDESSTSWYEQVYSIGFLCLQHIHILALSPQVTVYSAWIFAEHIQLWNQNSLHHGVLSQGGVDYIVSSFPEHNYWSSNTGV